MRTSASLPAGSRGALAAYGVVAKAASAIARRAILHGVPPEERAERLGTLPPPCGPGRVLLHAVSAGEVTAASALAVELERAAPGLGLVLTTGTREGRAAAERVREACPAVQSVAYLPWDVPGVVRGWLARLAPAAVVTVEAELWPGLFLGARELGIPVAVASGRLRPGEARRYALARPVFRPVLDAVAWVGARSDEDRDRFVAIGVDPSRVEVTGDLKLDAPTPRLSLPHGWAEELAAGAPVVVGASTHAPEEELLLRATARLAAEGIPVRLVLAPRDGTRTAEVERLAIGAGLRARRLSDGPGDEPVVVDDVFGLLPAFWPLASVAFLGGTVAPVGGHDPVGAARAGVPILAGPSVEGVRAVVAALKDSGGLVALPAGRDPSALAGALRGLLVDGEERARRGEAARGAVAALRGAAPRTAARLLALLGRL